MVKMLDLTNWLRRQPRDGVLLVGTAAGWQEADNVVLAERGAPPDPNGVSLMVVQQRFIADLVAKPLKGDEMDRPQVEDIRPPIYKLIDPARAMKPDWTPAEPVPSEPAPKKRGRPKSDS